MLLPVRRTLAVQPLLVFAEPAGLAGPLTPAHLEFLPAQVGLGLGPCLRLGLGLASGLGLAGPLRGISLIPHSR